MPKGENQTAQVSDDDAVVTVVLLGQNSADKCLIGNTMLGYNCFQPGKSMYQKALGRMRDELLYIINTPDLFWRICQEPEANAIEEMKPSYTGPLMFLLVLHDKQLSQEEVEMFTQMKERFGEKMTKNITVVLIDNKETSRQSCNIVDINLKKIVHECDERICVFSKDTADSDLVRQLLIHITKTPEKVEADPGSSSLSCRLHEDMKKEVDQQENDDSEQPKTMPGEDVNVKSFGGDCNIITMVLLGVNSDDKCLIGNSILQHDCFMAGKATCERVVARVADQMVCIVNTPDLFYKPSPDSVADNMEEMKPSYAGPRMFIMVLQDKTVSQEEMEMFAQLKERFGKKQLENMLVVLIGNEENNLRETFEADKTLKKILDECKETVYVYRSNVKSTELVGQLIGQKNMQAGI
ncbi:GTPase IMAP family member 8 [Sinocyclocheilus rhinocerous]|uniref:GTPase IMAP family member 8 n=1 Tax=Sinocyclocheilus rhinocerous TaxID=307959 RepID=UPI0007BABC87|nr:PREDICTED: GTPase IMAP family member 8-like [Sinocyclocheilus rhinocerous]